MGYCEMDALKIHLYRFGDAAGERNNRFFHQQSFGNGRSDDLGDRIGLRNADFDRIGVHKHHLL